MKSLSTYINEDVQLQQNETVLNEGLFGLISKFFKWLFSDDEPKKNKGKFPWDYDDNDWDTPKRRKPKKKNPKTTTITVKTTTTTTTEPSTTQTKNKQKTKQKGKKTLTQTVNDLTSDKDMGKKTKEIEQQMMQTDDDNQNVVQNTDTNVDNEPDVEKQTTVGVTPPSDPSPKIPLSELSMTRIDGNVEDPLAIMMAIFEQTNTNIRKNRGLWRAASLIDKKPSATHIDKRPWYIHYSTINYVDKCIIGLVAYSNDPYEYQRLLKDEEHGEYMHVFSFQMIDEYAKTTVIDDFVIDELIKIAKDSKNKGITIEHCDSKDLLKKHGFEEYDEEHQLMILNFNE